MRLFYIFITALVASSLALTNIYAVRAYPYPVKITQADGSEITIRLQGDEFFHYKTTEDGYPLVHGKRGILMYARRDTKGQLVSTDVRASNAERRSATERRFVQKLERNIDFSSQTRAQQSIRSAARVASATSPSKAYPLTGTPKSLVILVNFTDTAFTIPSPKTAFYNMLNQAGYSANGGTGSAKDYFRDNSMGVFNPNFDVVGPYTLPQKMNYYGKNDTRGDDTNPVQMIVDACSAADKDVDFTEYDTDKDGVIDNIFVYYAGYNEAEHGPENSIWPHRWGVYPGSNYTGSNASITFDGKRIEDYACSSELKGAGGASMCGIGTFCHEFGHVLGLPDLYATNGKTHHTLSDWDIMDYGPYLNGGRTPCGYSAYERFYLNWLKPTELKTPQAVSLDALSSSNKAYLISQSGNHNLNGAYPNPNEFFMLENRQKKGWDTYLPGHGLLVTRINYNATDWNNNTPNDNADAMGVDIIEADGIATDNSDTCDTYPGKCKVQLLFPMLRSGIMIKKNLVRISESNGVISFSLTDKVPELNINSSLNSFSTIQGTPTNAQTITVNGKYLYTDISLSFANNLHFEIKKESDTNWSKSIVLTPIDSIVNNARIQIRYNPSTPSFNTTHTNKLYLNSLGTSTMAIDLFGNSTRKVSVIPPHANKATDTTHTSFVANWNSVYDATGYYLTVYNIAEGGSTQTEGFDNGTNILPGWSINVESISSSTNFCGIKIPSLLFSNNNESVTTEEYLLPVSSLSFYLSSLDGYGGSFLIEGKNSKNVWDTIDNITVTTNIPLKNHTYALDATKEYNRFRFTYTKGYGAIAFDDVTVKYSKQLTFIAHENWIKKTNSPIISDTIKDLTPGTEYFYRVRASDKDLINNNYENITSPSNTVGVKTSNNVVYFQSRDKSQKIYRTKDGRIIIQQASKSDIIKVYDAIGHLIISTSKAEEIENVKLPPNQVYIIKVGEKALKIVL